jgi:hypothetical protein
MVTNIGGAKYTIEVEDKFSGGTKAFRDELTLNKEAFAAFRGEVITFATQQKEIRSNFKEFQSATSNISKNLKIQATAIKQISTSIGADTNTKLATKVRHINAQANAVGRLTAATRSRLSHVRKLRELTKGDIDRENQRLSAAKNATQSFKEFIKANRVQITSIRIKNKQLEREIRNLKAIRKLSPVFAAASGQTPAAGGKRKSRTSSTASNAAQTKKTILQTNNALTALRTGLDATALRANRISFTFRRLISILAAFTIVRRLTQGFVGLVREAVTFNANIEQATLGIASLLTAVGDVRDAFGGAVTPAQALELATRASRKQIQLLRVEALQTSATFKDLVDTFQVALAPGFQAGLNIDEIRAFTVQISQAATAIGLAQNQLAEEIRSLLAGTIQLRTTRIAAALGITNEDIRNAKELGNLYGFLQDRFKAFTLAGEKSVLNFNTILTNLQDAISLVVGSGLRPFFESIKESLQQINALILDTDISGNLAPSPTTVALLRVISRILVGLVDKSKQFATQFTASDIFQVLKAVETGLLSALSAAIVSISILVKGFREAARWARVIASFGPKIREAYDKLFPDPSLVQRMVTLFTTTLGAAVALRIVLFAISQLIKSLILPLSIIVGLTQSLLKPLGSIYRFILLFVTPVGAVVILIGIIVSEILKITGALFGFEIGLGTLIRLILLGIKAVWNLASSVLTGIAGTINGIMQGAVDFFLSFITRVASMFSGLGKHIAKALGLSSISKELEQMEKTADIMSRGFANDIGVVAPGGGGDLGGAVDSATKIADDIVDIGETAAEDWDKAWEKQAAGDGGLDGLAKDALGFVDDLVKGFDVSLPNAIDSTTEKVKSLVEELSNLDPIISSSTEDLREGQSTIEEIAKETRKLATELRFSAISIGSSDSLRGLLDVVKDSTLTIQDETEKADRKRRTALDTQNNLLNKHKRLLLDIGDLRNQEFKGDVDPTDALFSTIESTKEIDLLKGKEIGQTAALIKLERRLKESRASGDTQGIKTAESYIAAIEGVVDITRDRIKEAQTALGGFNKALLDSGVLTKAEIGNLVKGFITVEGSLVTASDELAEANRQRNSIIADQIGLRDLQLRQVIQNSKFELAAEKKVTEAAVAATKLRLQADDSTLTIQKDLLSAKADILEIDAELATLKIEEQKNQEVSNALIETMNLEVLELLALRDLGIVSLEEEKRLTDEIYEKNKLIKDVRDDIANNKGILKLRGKELAAIRAQKAKEAELRERGESSPVSAGLQLGINELIGTITDISAFINLSFAEAIQDAVVKGFDGSTDILGDAIVEALDPTEKGFSIRAAFATLFRQISKDIFQSLTSTISKALLSAASAGIAGLGNGGNPNPVGVFGQDSYHKGGKILTGANAHPAHYFRAQGLHSGGRPKPPPGVHPKDTVPIWAQPGEFMQPLNAVQTYGTQFMEAVRTLSLDPMQARALAGASSIKKRSGRTPKVGYATGGSISGPGDTGGGGSGGGVGRAVVVSDEQTYDRLLAQGRRPFMEMIKDNSAEIQAMLNSNRGAPIG